MLEKLKEFKDTFSERIRSPFLGSLIITWSLIHWKVYALFLFEQEDITISERISKIEEYLNSKTGCDLIVCPILLTLGILILYNILNAVGLAVKLSYDNWASPYIQQKLYNKNIIEKPKYEKLKREYDVLKKDFDEGKENNINAEKDRRDIRNSFDAFKKGAFEGQILDDIIPALNINHKWLNTYKFPDGTGGTEIFTTDKLGFILADGRNIKIENIKITPNGKILSFDKIIDGKAHPNYLVRDSALNYHGVEDEDTIISYTIIHDHKITLISAKYMFENNFIDVRPTIQKLLENNITEFKVTNELMGGDPAFEKKKTFVIVYLYNGKENHSSCDEGATIKLTA